MRRRIHPSQQSTHGATSVFPAPLSPNALAGSVSATLHQRPVYSYIVTTIKTGPGPNFPLRQTGSAPNFDGRRITLCTCKHKDRATFCPSGNSAKPWDRVWVVGFTSKSATPSRSLAYLMLVDAAFPDQYTLWHHLQAACRRAKSAVYSRIGDLYEPRPAASANPHDPRNYLPPMAGHVHSPASDPAMWHHDIAQWSSKASLKAKSHHLLLGDPRNSYRWPEARLRLNPNLHPPVSMGNSAHHKKFATLGDLIAALI